MKLTIQQCLFLLALPVAVSAQWRPVSDFGVVNIIPHDQSAETDENAEPSIGVAAGGGKFVVHAFSPDNSFANRYFTSTDNGIHWTNTGTLLDHDAALAWSPRGDAYAAILLPSHTAMNVLRSSDPSAGLAFSSIAAATYTVPSPFLPPDQPWIKVITVTNTDHLYIGFNDLSHFPGATASVRFSLDGGTTWKNTVLERVTPAGQDSPAVRLALSADKRTIYGLFQRWTSGGPSDHFGDVVLVRDDSFGSGSFNDLPNNGTLVANHVLLPWLTSLGVQRLGSGCDVAVNPAALDNVYVAYTEVLNHLPVLRVQHSSDRGANFNLVYTRTNASLPALAITKDGTVGLLFAAINGINLEIHFFKAYNGDFTLVTGPVFDPSHRPLSSDRVLARFPSGDPAQHMNILTYLGDYFGLEAVDFSFYGTFCASGQPDPSHFPSGVYYQRNVRVNGIVKNNFTLNASGTLVDLAGNNVAASIDPYFFYDVAPVTLATPQLYIEPPQRFPDDPRDRLYRFVWPTLPDFYPQFQPETSPVLGPLAHWTPATNTIIQTNGQFIMPLDQMTDQQFFRLNRDVASGQFQVFTSAGRGGALSPAGNDDGILLIPGTQSVGLTAVPDAEYGIANWYLDGMVVQSGGDSLAVTNISSDRTVLVTFAPFHDVAAALGALASDPEQPFLVGSNFDYVVTVQNTGLNPVTDVTMTDPLPPTVTLVEANTSQGTVGSAAGVVTAQLGSLEPGASAAITITVRPDSEGTITNTATVGCAEVEHDLANNSAGQITEVLTPVTITEQPASQSVNAGDTVVFHVGVSGTPPFEYQWAFNGVAIPGATSATLTLPNVTSDQAGFYSVTVSQVRGPEIRYDVYSLFAILEVF